MGYRDLFSGIIEPALAIGSGIGSEPIAGLYGLATGNPDNVQKLHHRLTYQPQGEAGQNVMESIGHGVDVAGEYLSRTPVLGDAYHSYNDMADRAGEYNPALGAFVKTLPSAAIMLAAPEASGAVNRVGSEVAQTVASGGNIGRGYRDLLSQRGAIDASVLQQPFIDALQDVRTVSKGGRAALVSREAAIAKGAKAIENTEKLTKSTKEEEKNKNNH